MSDEGRGARELSRWSLDQRVDGGPIHSSCARTITDLAVRRSRDRSNGQSSKARWTLRRVSIFLIAGVMLVAAACSSSDDSTDSASTTTTPASAATAWNEGVVPGYDMSLDEPSSLVIRPAGAAPIPVTGTDNKVHMAYELEVLNFSPRVATLDKLETLDGGPDGEVLASVEGAALAERTILIVDVGPNPTSEIQPGRSVLILVDDTYDTKAEVPETVTPRLTASFGPPTPEYEPLGRFFPEGEQSFFGPPVSKGSGTPVVIGPPLAGGGWLAANGCCTLNSHRGTMVPTGGRINAGERYGIDWNKVDIDAEPPPGRVAASYKGDPTKNEDYLAYGQPLLAVADGTVVNVVSDQPEAAPGETLPGLTMATAGGNVVMIDIGGGVFAFYAHMVPDSATVKVGDKVTRGQVIGKLGNSGNTSEVHLHFQLQASPAVFVGDNVPFEIDTLSVAGSFLGSGAPNDPVRWVPSPDAGPRTNQLPLERSVVSFPDAP